MKKSSGIGIAFGVFFVLSISFVSSYLSANIYLEEDGSATIIGSSSAPLNISGINFEKGRLFGVTQELTSKQGPLWNFAIALNDNAELKIFLPETAFLELASFNSSAESRVAISRQGIIISVAGQNPKLTFNYELRERSRLPFVLGLLGALAVIAVAILFFALRKKKTKAAKITKPKARAKTRKIDIIKKTLNEREREIVEQLLLLRKSKQSALQRKTGIPKSSFSRHLKTLENKGIIERVGEGRNKWLLLRKEMLAAA